MSHDRGCWKCGDDPPYDDCRKEDCPKSRHRRKSVLSKNDCIRVLKKLNEVQVSVTEFVLNGCPEKGFRDDQVAIISFIELHSLLEEYINQSLKRNK